MEGFEGFVRDGSFKWPVPRRAADDDDVPDRSPSAAGKSASVAGLSPMASAVVSRCSR